MNILNGSLAFNIEETIMGILPVKLHDGSDIRIEPRHALLDRIMRIVIAAALEQSISGDAMLSIEIDDEGKLTSVEFEGGIEHGRLVRSARRTINDEMLSPAQGADKRAGPDPDSE